MFLELINSYIDESYNILDSAQGIWGKKEKTTKDNRK